MREVRVYDGGFPSFDQILAGDPAAVFPKQIWLQQVQPGEYAVRFLRLAAEYQQKISQALKK